MYLTYFIIISVCYLLCIFARLKAAATTQSVNNVWVTMFLFAESMNQHQIHYCFKGW